MAKSRWNLSACNWAKQKYYFASLHQLFLWGGLFSVVVGFFGNFWKILLFMLSSVHPLREIIKPDTSTVPHSKWRCKWKVFLSLLQQKVYNPGAFASPSFLDFFLCFCIFIVIYVLMYWWLIVWCIDDIFPHFFLVNVWFNSAVSKAVHTVLVQIGPELQRWFNFL